MSGLERARANYIGAGRHLESIIYRGELGPPGRPKNGIIENQLGIYVIIRKHDANIVSL